MVPTPRVTASGQGRGGPTPLSSAGDGSNVASVLEPLSREEIEKRWRQTQAALRESRVKLAELRREIEEMRRRIPKPSPGRPKFWTEDKLLDLARMADNGLTAKQIARITDMTPEAIRSAASEAGISLRGRHTQPESQPNE